MKKVKCKLFAAGLITMLGMGMFKGITVEANEVSISNINVMGDVNANNIEAQDYEAWTKPVNSYMLETEKGLMTVNHIGEQIAIENGKMLVSYYDNNYHISEKIELSPELPIWGGFAASSDAYYIVTGQNNTEESDAKEVIRITKYDKNWNRVASVAVSGCNVYKPFDFAAVRMDFYKNYLILKTGRLIYTTPDGKNHQVQLSLEVNTTDMTIVQSGTDYGYVSHSLNQYIKVDNSNNKIISVEQGDAYPRGIVLFESENCLESFKGGGDSLLQKKGLVKSTIILEVPKNDDYYQNLRASIGGLEISDTNYLVAGNSVVQDAERANRTTRNIFVAVKSKSSDENRIVWLTSYEEGKTTVRTPHMIKIDDNKFMVIWSRNDRVYYTNIDGCGNKTSQIYSFEGNLSDCQPILYNGKICWYTVNGIDLDFYEISAVNQIEYCVKRTQGGHQYEVQQIQDGKATMYCSGCGHTEYRDVPINYSTLWNTAGTYKTYHYGLPDKSTKLSVGNKIYFWCKFDDKREIDTTMIINISNPKILSYKKTSTNMGYFTVLAKGKVTVTFYPKDNPGLIKTFTLVIKEIKPKLSSKKLIVRKADTVKLSMLNTSKKVTWKISSGKKYIKLKKKYKTRVIIRGVKKGRATVQARTDGKKYMCTVRVVD